MKPLSSLKVYKRHPDAVMNQWLSYYLKQENAPYVLSMQVALCNGMDEEKITKGKSQEKKSHGKE